MKAGAATGRELPPDARPTHPARLDPLFRWPGGKRWLVSQLLDLVPGTPKRYFEPFVGAGALFFALNPRSAVLRDANADLIRCYTAIRDNHREVARLLAAMPQTAANYYFVRASRPQSEVSRAARFIFLATHAFNGIYRVNRRGDFNVPYGGRTYARLTEPDLLVEYAARLAVADLQVGDFEAGLDDANAGDLVYLDPPYTVAHENNGFLKYNDRIFSWPDQERLARVAQRLCAKGVAVVVSNARHPSTAELYGFLRAIPVERESTIAADPGRRGTRREYVFTNLDGIGATE